MSEFFKRLLSNDNVLQKDWIIFLFSISYIGTIIYAIIEWTRDKNISGLLSIIETLSYQISIIIAGTFGVNAIQIYGQNKQESVNFNQNMMNPYGGYNSYNSYNNYIPYNNYNQYPSPLVNPLPLNNLNNTPVNNSKSPV